MRLFSRTKKGEPSQVEITVSSQTVIRVIALVIAAFLAIHFIRLASHPLVLIFVSAFLALALNPAVSWISSRLKSKSRVRGTAVAYITVITILAVFIALVVPPLVRQTYHFVADAPRVVNDFQTKDTALARAATRYNINDKLDEFSSGLSSRFTDIKPVFSTAGRVFANIVSVITVLVLTFMMLVEGPRWMEIFWELYPDGESEQHHKHVFKRMHRVVTAYVNGQLVIAVIAGMAAMLALLIASTLLHVSINVVALAGIIMLFGLIPLIGNTLGACIVVVICLFSSLPLAIIMGVYFLLYQQIENVTLQPLIQAKSNELTPLLVFVAALIGVSIGGILGAFVAIPTVGCIKIAIEEYYLKRKLLMNDEVDKKTSGATRSVDD